MRVRKLLLLATTALFGLQLFLYLHWNGLMPFGGR